MLTVLPPGRIVRPRSFGQIWSLTKGHCRSLLSCCISDAHKSLLLRNPTFIEHLIDGLLLDPEHHVTKRTRNTVTPITSADCLPWFWAVVSVRQGSGAARQTMRAA
jgi:hypothetical protein